MSSVDAVLSRYEENAKWISKHYEELKKKFKDEWIAVLIVQLLTMTAS